MTRSNATTLEWFGNSDSSGESHGTHPFSTRIWTVYLAWAQLAYRRKRSPTPTSSLSAMPTSTTSVAFSKDYSGDEASKRVLPSADQCQD